MKTKKPIADSATLTPVELREPQRESAEDRILIAAHRFFDHHGVVRITMEEIARDQHISKKTLYKYFPNKEALVRGVVRAKMQEGAARLEPIFLSRDLQFVTRLSMLMEAIGVQSASMSPTFLIEVGQVMPEVWKEVEEFRRARLERLGGLLRQGVREGYIRTDIEIDLAVLAFITLVQSLVVPQFLRHSAYSFPQLLEGILSVVFEGILTPSGRKNVQIAGKIGGAIAKSEFARPHQLAGQQQLLPQSRVPAAKARKSSPTGKPRGKR